MSKKTRKSSSFGAENQMYEAFWPANKLQSIFCQSSSHKKTINLDELKALKIPSQVSPRVCLTWQEWSCGFSKRFNPLSITGMKENKNHSNHLQPMVIREHPVTCLTQNSVWRLSHFGQRLSPDVLTRSNKTMQPQWTGCENFPDFFWQVYWISCIQETTATQ